MTAGGRAGRGSPAIRNNASTLRGSCLCGKVTYEVRGAPEVMYYCHCGMCRRATGSSFATNMVVREADFAVTSGQDRIKAYLSSPGEHRHFCSECGSPLFSRAESRRGKLSVRCGTLQDDSPIRPSAHLHTASKAPWTEICDRIPRFDGQAEW